MIRDKTLSKHYWMHWVSFIISILCITSCESTGTVATDESKLAGTWQLDAITYGLSQTRLTGDKLPYTETIDFKSNGEYLIKQNGKTIESGQMTSGQNTFSNITTTALFYKKDNSYQAYKIAEGRLYMYERVEQGAVIADGAMFEYIRL